MKVNSDLLQGYLLATNERDQCALLVDLIAECQKEHLRLQSANVEN